jgi:hypothetical protein
MVWTEITITIGTPKRQKGFLSAFLAFHFRFTVLSVYDSVFDVYVFLKDAGELNRVFAFLYR